MISSSFMVSANANPIIATLSKRSYASSPSSDFLCMSRLVAFPLVASVSVLLWTNPVNAGILSGFSGLESVPGPELPKIDFLNKWNEDNQKKYAELDSQFKSSKVLKELLEKSKQNKERNERLIQDKYCLRGAEWGVGDCSTQGMTQQERDDFVAMLKKRTGEE
ncbi:Acetyl-CoA decarbonylase/synthase complex subunit alpha 1 [Rhynchospora pubera]|uniref:Acetyl-CoA decarbonylase/synthase complex subunit alpha 1 n=1 Tax=Rhynchospora pubera TaxID=906938 RepID=A0AAV8HYB3_9POAL|nr:Acetyl-CoA decarbonylase/synthase complex subunit alpha 1 [Rhynchospora pubera]